MSPFCPHLHLTPNASAVISNLKFSIGSGGRTSIMEHEGREKHKLALQSQASS